MLWTRCFHRKNHLDNDTSPSSSSRPAQNTKSWPFLFLNFLVPSPLLLYLYFGKKMATGWIHYDREKGEEMRWWNNGHAALKHTYLPTPHKRTRKQNKIKGERRTEDWTGGPLQRCRSGLLDDDNACSCQCAAAAVASRKLQALPRTQWPDHGSKV